MKHITILFIVAGMICSSCGASWHLKRAIAKGAKVTKDSAQVDLIRPGSESDSTLHYKQLAAAYKKRNGELESAPDPTFAEIIYDTIVNETTKWRVKTKIDTATRTIYQNVYIKPDTVKVFVDTGTTVSANNERDKMIWASLGATGVLIMFLILAYLLNKWKK